MTNQITTVNVTTSNAGTPNSLQSTGALISLGGTTLIAQHTSLLTQLSDLTPLLAANLALSSLTSSSTVATATTAATTVASGSYNSGTGLVTLTLTADIGAKVGSSVIVASATGTGSFASINGTFVAGAGSTGTTLTYTIATGLTLTISGGAVTIGHGITVADTFWTTIAGATPTVYNGEYLATATSATQFTYTFAGSGTSPATGTITYTPRGADELLQMATTFFTQGSRIGVYVLELGQVEPAAGVTALNTWLTNNGNPQIFYSYLCPREFDNATGFVTLCTAYESDTAKTYFFVTTTTGNYHLYAGIKSVIAMVEAPNVAVTEFSLSSTFWDTLAAQPGASTPVPPLTFTFEFGVTPWAPAGNQTTLQAFETAGVNYIGTGAEGGLSNTIVFWGTNMDVNPWNVWYSIDWVQIQSQQAITNEIINGSNNSAAPLFYNQPGIARLQARAAKVGSTAISAGLSVGQLLQTQLDPTTFANNLADGVYDGFYVVNAVPFKTYTTLNPNDYAIGQYNGLTAAYAPQVGFKHIVFNINASGLA